MWQILAIQFVESKMINKGSVYLTSTTVIVTIVQGWELFHEQHLIEILR